MSIQSNFPAIKPTLLLDFANTKQLDPRITFTRASTATYYGTQTAKAEENLLLQSQTLDNASWTKSNAAVSGTDTIVAPDGTTTAEEVRDGTATNIHSAFQGLTLASGTTYVASVFLKNVDRQYAILAVSGSVSAYASAKFDLIGGTSTANQAGGAGWSVTSVAMTPVGSDWYRCVLVFVSGTSGSCNVRIGLASDGTTFTTNGSGLESYTGTDLKIAVWGAQLEQRSAVTAYTPTTTQAITNYIPQLLTAASGVARFDHNPTTFESLGLEIEESRTNLILQSETCNVSPWASSSPYSVTANTAIAPDGAQTADALIVESGQSSFSTNVTRQVVSKAASAIQYTRSGYFKALGATTSVRLQDLGNLSANNASVIVSLIDGSVVTAPSVTGAFTGASVAVSNAGNGWWRVAFTYTTDAHTSLTVRSFPYVGASALTGDGFSGLLAWGAQLEAGAFATSYIPTVASQVTRAADAASMTGTNFSSWYNQAEGAMYAEVVSAPVANIAQQAWYISDSTSSNSMALRRNTAGLVAFAVNAGGVGQADVSGGSVSAGASYKFAAVYKVNDFAVSLNAGSVTTDTSGSVPVVNQLNIGVTAAGAQYLNGTIKKIAYYPLRVTNAKLQGLTS